MSLIPTVGDTPVITGSVNTSTVGATGIAQVLRPDGTHFTHSVTFTTPATGAWSFACVAGDLNQAGTYWIEVKVTFAGGAIQTFAVDSNDRETHFNVLTAYA